MSERTCRRRGKRFNDEGEDGLCERRLGRRAGSAVPEEEAERWSGCIAIAMPASPASMSTSTCRPVSSHNARFTIAPAEAGSAFVAVNEAQWPDVLAIHKERTVAPDNTVAWKGRRLQLPPHSGRARFVRAKVKVHVYPDGELAIFHGPRCLVRSRPGEDAADPDSLQPRCEPLAPQPERPVESPDEPCRLAHPSHRHNTTKRSIMYYINSTTG